MPLGDYFQRLRHIKPVLESIDVWSRHRCRFDARLSSAEYGRMAGLGRIEAPERRVAPPAPGPQSVEGGARNGRGDAVGAPVADEYPLTPYVDNREVVALMALGQAAEALAIGYLRNGRIAKAGDE